MIQFITIFLSISTILFAHQNDGAQGQRKTYTENRLCVCQYQEFPMNCGKGTRQTCTSIDEDCIWVGSESRCKNWHQHQCETEFLGRHPGLKCSSVSVVPNTASSPACEPGFTHYFYTYQGHGGIIDHVLATFRNVTAASHPSCRFTFEDQSCLSFSNNNIPGSMHVADVRSKIQKQLRHHLKGTQDVLWIGNQVEAIAQKYYPYNAENPFYSFQFNRKELYDEKAVSCKFDVGCGKSTEGRKFICQDPDDSNKKLVKTCCQDSWTDGRVVSGFMLGGLIGGPVARGYHWRANVLECPSGMKILNGPQMGWERAEETVHRLWRGALFRPAEEAEWVPLSSNLRHNPSSIAEIAKKVGESKELQDKLKTLGRQRVVENLYRELFQRKAQAFELENAIHTLHYKGARAMLNEILTSKEFEEELKKIQEN